jgi:hypothetical protein
MEEYDDKLEDCQKDNVSVRYSEMYKINLSRVYSIISLYQLDNSKNIDYTPYYDLVNNLDVDEGDYKGKGKFGYYYYDIDCDGIYELIISTGSFNGDNAYNFYTLKDGELVEIVPQDGNSIMRAGDPMTNDFEYIVLSIGDRAGLYYDIWGADHVSTFSIGIVDDKLSLNEGDYYTDESTAYDGASLFFIDFDDMSYLENLLQTKTDDIAVETTVAKANPSSTTVSEYSNSGTSTTKEVTSAQELSSQSSGDDTIKRVAIIVLVGIAVSVIVGAMLKVRKE